MIITFIFIIINMEKCIANINYDSLNIKNTKLIKLKPLPKKGEISALAAISKYLH
jgi:hypothetical protein